MDVGVGREECGDSKCSYEGVLRVDGSSEGSRIMLTFADNVRKITEHKDKMGMCMKHHRVRSMNLVTDFA